MKGSNRALLLLVLLSTWLSVCHSIMIIQGKYRSLPCLSKIALWHTTVSKLLIIVRQGDTSWDESAYSPWGKRRFSGIFMSRKSGSDTFILPRHVLFNSHKSGIKFLHDIYCIFMSSPVLNISMTFTWGNFTRFVE